MLVNLVANAIKFTEEGRIVVHVSVAERHAEECVLHFAVTDTGIGLSPEQRAKLFRNFVQADTSTTRKYGGTGLGLAICKNIAELMKGHIDVQSELGRGSTFTLAARFAVGAHHAPVAAVAKPTRYSSGSMPRVQLPSRADVTLEGLVELHALLVQGSYAAMARCEALGAPLTHWLGGEASAFRTALEDFDFERAASILSETAAAHGVPLSSS